MLMMVSANDLMALYLGIELQSLALYVVAAFRRDSVRSSEAGLKYFVLGALSSGILLYGLLDGLRLRGDDQLRETWPRNVHRRFRGRAGAVARG